MTSVEGYVLCPSCAWQGRRTIPDKEYRGPVGPCPKCQTKVRSVGPGYTISPEIASTRASLVQAAGPSAKVMVWVRKSEGIIRVKLRCHVDGPHCKVSNPAGTRMWETASDGRAKGTGSTAEFALDLWANHLDRHLMVCPWSFVDGRGEAVHVVNEAESGFWKNIGLEPPR